MDWLDQHGLLGKWSVGSAGVFAVDGSEPSPEVAALLASRGISQVGRSSSLTLGLLREASIVLAMTPSVRVVPRRNLPSTRCISFQSSGIVIS